MRVNERMKRRSVGRTTHAAVQAVTLQVLDTISVTSLVLAGLALVLRWALGRRRPRLAIGVGIMVGGANMTTQVLKSEALSRPDLLHRVGAASTPSFPSVHATVARACCSRRFGAGGSVPAAGRGGIAWCCVIAALMGGGTLTAGWHRPSDVIGAYLVVGTWAAMGPVAGLSAGVVPGRLRGGGKCFSESCPRAGA